mmetsp:Transcript_63850/g.148762  ORF Transcript_63850/g.148762 Transcript_63850/m.148762 type:complete len:250 (+) Transcript_63850:63-812(+)
MLWALGWSRGQWSSSRSQAQLLRAKPSWRPRPAGLLSSPLKVRATLAACPSSRGWPSLPSPRCSSPVVSATPRVCLASPTTGCQRQRLSRRQGWGPPAKSALTGGSTTRDHPARPALRAEPSVSTLAAQTLRARQARPPCSARSPLRPSPRASRAATPAVGVRGRKHRSHCPWSWAARSRRPRRPGVGWCCCTRLRSATGTRRSGQHQCHRSPLSANGTPWYRPTTRQRQHSARHLRTGGPGRSWQRSL